MSFDSMLDFNFDSLSHEREREAKFKIGDEVVDPISGLSGTVVQVEKPVYDWMGSQYQVVLSNGTRSRFDEDCLQRSFDTKDVFAICENRNFSNYEDYMIVNTLFKIDNVNSNTISTLRASRTQFKAYQFKPLLKFFASPSKRILIADEVGLGKTIETGHILLELKARKEFRHALIVCPKSLREKWRAEMERRFGIDFTIYGGEDNAGNKYPSMPDLMNAYKSGRDVHAIVNYERIRYKAPRKDDNDETSRKSGLIDFLVKSNIRHSVVICDESHRLRNDETLAYGGAEALLPMSDAAIFLTATPVMIKEENLYNQMHLLCPEKYSDAQIFANRMSQGRPFVLALNELGRCALPDVWRRLSSQRVERIMQTEAKSGTIVRKKEMSVEDFFADDPIYGRLKTLFHSADNAKTRVALQTNLVKMSAIQNEFTRTTKRQIRNELSKVNERFPTKITVVLKPDEQKEFERVINDYDKKNNTMGTANLGLVQIKRMVSSSVYGYLNEPQDIDRGIDVFEDKPDAKVDALVNQVLRPSASNHNRLIKKVVVFAVFIGTLRYLKVRLGNLGIRCAIIDGSVADRQDVIDRFRADDEIRVLLSSEVGSEGLDMQFCDTIVNFDLPWNPMVVEQRIGRIDRIGQTAERIYIYNLIVKGSITEDIYERLEKRIGIFEGTIGDLEPILNAPYKNNQSILEAHNDIEIKYYKGEITKEQALREEELINEAIESQRMTIAELSSELGKNTISEDSYYKDEISRIQNQKAYVTDVELRNLLVKALKIKETGCSQCSFERLPCEESVWLLKIPHNLDDRNCLVDFLNRNRPRTSDSLKAYDEFVNQIRGKTELRITFDQTMANENPRMIFVNNYSPLIQACNEFRARSRMPVKKVFKLELDSGADKKGSIRTGDRFFMLNYQLSISDATNDGSGSVKELCPILFDINREEVVSDEDVISIVCSLSQDNGRETQMPSADECSREMVAKFKMLATKSITKILSDKKKDREEQSNVERKRWRKEIAEFYESKIDYYETEIKKLSGVIDGEAWKDSYPSLKEERTRLRNEISGYAGTVTRLKRERDVKLSALDCESIVSITREEVSICYIKVR